MRKWKVLAALVAVVIVTPTVLAQTQEEIIRDLQDMKTRLAALESENSALKSQVAGQDDQVLENQINALTERYAAGTTVKSAANPVTLTGEFRFRNWYTLGDNRGANDEHDGSWTDSLVRLGTQYDFTKDVTAFAELQAHWAFGDSASTDYGESETPVTLYQGWLEIRNIFNRPEFSSRTGRQEIVLGNQFHFGNADFYNGWNFDASRWDWDSESFSISAILAKLDTADGDFNQGPSWLASHDDDQLYSLYFTLKSIKNMAIDIYWIYVEGHGNATTGGTGLSWGSLNNPIGSQASPGTAYYHTLGARIGGVFPDVAAGLDFNLEFAYQFGDQRLPGPDADIDAFALEAEVGLTFTKDSKFRVYARFLWAMGPDDDDGLGYIPLYPNRHSNGGFRARYGLVDLIPMTNVVTPQLGMHFDPDPAWTIGLTGLWATTDDTAGVGGIIPGNAIPDEDYGWEVDLWAEHRYSENLTLGAAIAVVFPDDSFADYYGAEDDAQWFFMLQARLLF